MSAPKQVRHTCGTWLLQHSDAITDDPFWIVSVETSEALILCPCCGASLRQAHERGELRLLGEDSLAPIAAEPEISDLKLKLATLTQLQSMLAPRISGVLRGISADLQGAAS